MTSHPEFNEKTTATEVANSFADRIQNRNVVITGVGPKSLGESMALAIAAHNPAKLILASRTLEKLRQVADEISKKSPQASSAVELVTLDLASQQSVQAAANRIAELVDSIDILINNAGIMVLSPEKTAEGIELQFGTNHIGHFLFTNLLIDKLKKAAGSRPPGNTRIINVSSAGHRLSPIRFHDYNIEGKDVPDEEQPPPEMLKVYGKVEKYNGWIAYGQSKTANILFSVYLNQKLAPAGVVSYAVHPGSIWTNLNRNLDEEGNNILAKTGKYWKTNDEGAAPMLIAAFDPKLDATPQPSGAYLHECQVAQPAPWASDVNAAERLAQLSEELVGRKFKL
ncbi:hypothetical protein VTN31DRAFT_141 [Thermomyces dupontii]|uniref:uncharacterized protein n=1 Tax=Talaromyces thermophilus TaxID=28565 RepID=UPI0037447CE9